jgi:replication-associated recombination protein RarA
MFAEQLTPGGYLCGEVASALQKSIRRGLVDDALFWATELDLGGYGNYVWKRLRIIASEDVGLADSTVAATVRALYENWTEAVKKKEPAEPERLFLVHAVILLAGAPKSRMVDHALMVMYEGDRETREIPDYALDKHTAAGKRLGRGHDHFFNEGAVLGPPLGEFDDPYAEAGREARTRSNGRRWEVPPAAQGSLSLDG